jgi:DNA primase
VAGDAAARRGIEIAQKAQLIIKIIEGQSREINPKEYKDPGEWAMADPKGWKLAVEKAVPIYDFYMDSAVKRLGLDAIGKTKVGRELIPIWAKIDDAILKAHYVKRLAEVLGVAEEDIKEQLAKAVNSGKPSASAAATEEPAKTNSRREVLEEYLVRMALGLGDVAKLMEPKTEVMIKNDFWRKVIDQFKKEKGLWNKPGELVHKLPAELVRKTEELLMLEEEMEPEMYNREWEKAVRELEQVDVHERLEVLRHLSDKPETEQEVARLTKRLFELTKSM